MAAGSPPRRSPPRAAARAVLALRQALMRAADRVVPAELALYFQVPLSARRGHGRRRPPRPRRALLARTRGPGAASRPSGRAASLRPLPQLALDPSGVGARRCRRDAPHRSGDLPTRPRPVDLGPLRGAPRGGADVRRVDAPRDRARPPGDRPRLPVAAAGNGVRRRGRRRHRAGRRARRTPGAAGDPRRGAGRARGGRSAPGGEGSACARRPGGGRHVRPYRG